MKKIKIRIGILFILLTVFTMFASCLNDDDEPKDKQKTEHYMFLPQQENVSV